MKKRKLSLDREYLTTSRIADPRLDGATWTCGLQSCIITEIVYQSLKFVVSEIIDPPPAGSHTLDDCPPPPGTDSCNSCLTVGAEACPC